MNYSPTLRISREHYDQLHDLITPLDTHDRRHKYITGDYPNAERTKDTDMRYRWDLVWAAPRSNQSRLFTAMYDEGLNDVHIDSALKRIVPALLPEKTQ